MTRFGLALPFAAVLLAGCTTARIPLPPSLATSPLEYAVQGISPRRSGAPVRIGPYTARLLDDGATFSWAVPVGDADVGRSARRYAFALEGGDASAIEVACLNRAWTLGHGGDDRLTIDVTRLAGPLLDCTLRDIEGREGRLEVSRRGRDMLGRLQLPDGDALPLRSSATLEGSPLGLGVPTAYLLGSEVRTQLVVDVVTGQRVLLDPAVAPEQRTWMAAAATALMLMDPELE